MAAKLKLDYGIRRTGIFEYVLECPDLDIKIRGESAKEVTHDFFEVIERYFAGSATVNSIKMQKKHGDRWMLVSLT